MNKKRRTFSIITFLVCCVQSVPTIRCQETNQIPLIDRMRFQSILDALESPLTRNENRDMAATNLLALGTSSLPYLMKEVKAVGYVEATNVTAATEQNMKLQAAFEVLGTTARPLLHDLINEFEAGRSLGITPYAIAQIGGDEAGIALVKAITNPVPSIRISAISAIQYFKNYPKITQDAIPLLIKSLTDRYGPLRSMVANSLGILQTDPNVVVPALLRTAEEDTDVAVRAVAIKSISSFGTNAAFAGSSLQKIAKSDSDEYIREIASRALQSIKN